MDEQPTATKPEPDPSGPVTTVARIAVPDDGPVALARAVRTVERTVRPSDRVCPVAGHRITVSFDADAAELPVRSIAERLAGAVQRTHRPGRRQDREHPAAGSGDTVVVVERSTHASALRRRTVVSSRADRQASAAASRGTALVVEFAPRSTGTAGPVAGMAVTALEGAGYRVAVLAGGPVTAGPSADVVVLVVGPEPSGGPGTWETSTWCVPTQVAAALTRSGVRVVALDAGSSAGALAGCLGEGAVIVRDVEDLADEVTGAEPDDRDGHTVPAGRDGDTLDLRRLLLLTPSERRVLFHLTRGRSPQETADALVVSLTTVRSHIRAVLTKLNVRSQLAAVAVANGRHAPPPEAGPPPSPPAGDDQPPDAG